MTLTCALNPSKTHVNRHQQVKSNRNFRSENISLNSCSSMFSLIRHSRGFDKLRDERSFRARIVLILLKNAIEQFRIQTPKRKLFEESYEDVRNR